MISLQLLILNNAIQPTQEGRLSPHVRTASFEQVKNNSDVQFCRFKVGTEKCVAIELTIQINLNLKKLRSNFRTQKLVLKNSGVMLHVN